MPNQRNSSQPRITFDLTQRDWSSKWFDWGKIDSGPIAFLCGCISIGRARHVGNPDCGFVVTAMIKKDFIALAHSAEIISRSVIAHARPAGPAFCDKLRPRVRGRFLFHEPETFHGLKVIRKNSVRKSPLWLQRALSPAHLLALKYV